MDTIDSLAWIKDGVAVLYFPHPCASSGYRAVVDGTPRLLGEAWVVSLRDMKPFGGLDHRGWVAAAHVDHLRQSPWLDPWLDTGNAKASGFDDAPTCAEDLLARSEERANRLKERANCLDDRARTLEGMLIKQKEVEDGLRKEFRMRMGSSRESELADKCGALETQNKELLLENARLRRKLDGGRV